MAHEMRVDLRVSGINRYLQAADAIEKMARAQRNLNSAMGSSGGQAGGTAGSAIVVAGGGGGGGGNNRTPTPKAGPFARYQQAQANMQLALQSGNPSAIADAQILLQRSSMSLQRLTAGPPGFMSRLNRLVGSTRVGGTVQPLVGQTLGLLGVSSKFMGPIGLATAALVGLYQATKWAAGEIRNHSKAMAEGGGTAGETKTAKLLSAATGVDIISLGRQFQKSFFDGGMESMHLRRYGYSAAPGMARDTNSTGPALQALRKMVNAGDLRALQDVGAAGLYDLKLLSNKEQERYWEMQKKSLSEDSRAAALRFNLAMEELKMNMMDLAVAATPIIRFFGAIAGGMADMYAEKNPARMAMNYAMPFATLPGYIADRYKEIGDPRKDAIDRQSDALDRNTQSNYRLSESLDQVSKEVRGIGDRARSAVPDM